MKFDGVDLSDDNLLVSREEFEEAKNKVDPQLAEAKYIAADMLSQTEHGTGYEANVIFCTDEKKAQEIKDCVLNLKEENNFAVDKSLENYGAIYVVDSIDDFFSLVYQHMQHLYQTIENIILQEVRSQGQWEEKYLEICFSIRKLCKEYPIYFEGMIGDINIDIASEETPQVYKDIYNLGLRLNGLVRKIIEKGALFGIFKPDCNADKIMIFFWSSISGIVRMAEYKKSYYKSLGFDNAEYDTFAAQGVDTAGKQTENCSAFFVITGNDTVMDWINAGRKTQAFWYRCVENNISIQPLSAMLEVVPYSEDIQSRLGVTESVQMILRAGYVNDYGENAGVRRDLKDYITVINGD